MCPNYTVNITEKIKIFGWPLRGLASVSSLPLKGQCGTVKAIQVFMISWADEIMHIT